MNVHVASVSAYIPSAEINAPSGGSNLEVLASSERQAQLEAQEQDARERTTIWDAEKIGRLDSLDVDAEFEADPEFPPHTSAETSHDEWLPMGTRVERGDIMPFAMWPPSDRNAMDVDTDGATQELLFTGRAECVPDCVQHLVSSIVFITLV